MFRMEQGRSIVLCLPVCSTPIAFDSGHLCVKVHDNVGRSVQSTSHWGANRLDAIIAGWRLLVPINREVAMEFLKLLIDLIEKIPATFWGVVVGAFFSMAGVWATNRASSKRMSDQFEHEHRLKTLEREMSLRKEIYLELAEAVNAAIQDAYRFGNLEIPHSEVTKDFVEKSPAMAKVHVIGKTQTIQALAAFSSEVNAAFYKLWAKRHLLFRIKEQIAQVDRMLSEIAAERDRYLALSKQFNLDGEISQLKWKVITENFEAESKRANSLLEERGLLGKTLEESHYRFVNECSETATSFGTTLLPLVKAVREELELPLDLDAYRALQEENITRQREALEGFLRELGVTQPDPGGSPLS